MAASAGNQGARNLNERRFGKMIECRHSHRNPGRDEYVNVLKFGLFQHEKMMPKLSSNSFYRIFTKSNRVLNTNLTKSK